jgi:hypothetical protein
MSELSDILTARVTVKRLTADLLDKVATGLTLTPDRQPPDTCRMALEASGCTISSGTVTITGSTVETLTVAANGVVVGQKDFSMVSGITVGGISDGYIRAWAVSKTGQPMTQERQVTASLAVRFYAVSARIRMLAVGKGKIAQHKIMAASGSDIKENDYIYALSGMSGLTRGLVSFVEDIYDFDGVTHHMEAEIMTP